jgi:hypothetical protein
VFNIEAILAVCEEFEARRGRLGGGTRQRAR